MTMKEWKENILSRISDDAEVKVWGITVHEPSSRALANSHLVGADATGLDVLFHIGHFIHTQSRDTGIEPHEFATMALGIYDANEALRNAASKPDKAEDGSDRRGLMAKLLGAALLQNLACQSEGEDDGE